NGGEQPAGGSLVCGDSLDDAIQPRSHPAANLPAISAICGSEDVTVRRPQKNRAIAASSQRKHVPAWGPEPLPTLRQNGRATNQGHQKQNEPGGGKSTGLAEEGVEQNVPAVSRLRLPARRQNLRGGWPSPVLFRWRPGRRESRCATHPRPS